MSYLLLNHVSRERAIRLAVKSIRAAKLDFESVVSCGLSGALVAPAIAARLNKQLIIVRKGEVSHGHQVEIDWLAEADRYIIVDDLVESGKTIQRIQRALNGSKKYGGTCVGVYFYAQDENAVYVERFKKRNTNLWIAAHL